MDHESAIKYHCCTDQLLCHCAFICSNFC